MMKFLVIAFTFMVLTASASTNAYAAHCWWNGPVRTCAPGWQREWREHEPRDEWRDRRPREWEEYPRYRHWHEYR